MNLDDYKQATPESEMRLRNYFITVTFIAHENDEEYVRRNLSSTFSGTRITVRDFDSDVLEFEVEFEGEYEEGNVVESVRDEMYSWIIELGLMQSDIEVSYD